MSPRRVVVLRGTAANPWDLRAWEDLGPEWDVSVVVPPNNQFDTGAVRPAEGGSAHRGRPPRVGRLPGRLALKAVGQRHLGLDAALAVRTSSMRPSSALVRGAGGGASASARLPAGADGLGDAALRGRLPQRARARPTAAACCGHRPVPRRSPSAPAPRSSWRAPRRAHARLPAGIDVDRFAAARRAAARRRPARILSIGRLVWEKGHQDVLRALALLRGARPRRRARADRRDRARRSDACRRWRARPRPRRSRGAARLVPHDQLRRLAGASCLVLGLHALSGRSSSAWCSPRPWRPAYRSSPPAAGAIPEVLGTSGTLFGPATGSGWPMRSRRARSRRRPGTPRAGPGAARALLRAGRRRATARRLRASCSPPNLRRCRPCRHRRRDRHDPGARDGAVLPRAPRRQTVPHRSAWPTTPGDGTASGPRALPAVPLLDIEENLGLRQGDRRLTRRATATRSSSSTTTWTSSRSSSTAGRAAARPARRHGRRADAAAGTASSSTASASRSTRPCSPTTACGTARPSDPPGRLLGPSGGAAAYRRAAWEAAGASTRLLRLRRGPRPRPAPAARGLGGGGGARRPRRAPRRRDHGVDTPFQRRHSGLRPRLPPTALRRAAQPPCRADAPSRRSWSPPASSRAHARAAPRSRRGLARRGGGAPAVPAGAVDERISAARGAAPAASRALGRSVDHATTAVSPAAIAAARTLRRSGPRRASRAIIRQTPTADAAGTAAPGAARRGRSARGSGRRARSRWSSCARAASIDAWSAVSGGGVSPWRARSRSCRGVAPGTPGPGPRSAGPPQSWRHTLVVPKKAAR